MLKHWKTSVIGIVAIIYGIWSGYIAWVPVQTIHYTLVYVMPGHIAAIVAGIGLLLAADHDKK